MNKKITRPKAVVLLSGGLDSAVTLFYAIKKGYDCRCLTFDYGQRHKKETLASGKIASFAGGSAHVVRLGFPWRGSSLTDKGMKLPVKRSAKDIKAGGIPNTYVPARNTVFLSIAVSMAEAIGAERVFIGAHSDDSSGYPDCTQAYLEAFNRAAGLGTRAGREGKLKIEYPLIKLNKKEIIMLGMKLGVPFGSTWSCYKGLSRPCGVCDSCVLRAKGFEEAGMEDPAIK